MGATARGGFAALLVPAVLWLALATGTAGRAAGAAPQAKAWLVGPLEVTLPSNPEGSFASYRFAYAGDGSKVSVRLALRSPGSAPAGPVGFAVFGPDAVGVLASGAISGGATACSAEFASSVAGTYLLQVFGYGGSAVPLALEATREVAGRVVALDPGHGGPEVGAASPDGSLAEKDVNLKIALKLAALLRADGYEPVLTRDSDRSVSPEYRGGGYSGGVGRDLQARIDTANAAGASLFISIHNNGGPPSESGTEVWYSAARTFGDRNVALARLVQSNLVRQLREMGYPVRDRGIKDDATFRVFRGRAYNIYVLGPGDGPRAHVPTAMPGVLGESLFLSSPVEAALLRQERTLDAIAQGYRAAVRAYFEAYPE